MPAPGPACPSAIPPALASLLPRPGGNSFPVPGRLPPLPNRGLERLERALVLGRPVALGPGPFHDPGQRVLVHEEVIAPVDPVPGPELGHRVVVLQELL